VPLNNIDENCILQPQAITNHSFSFTNNNNNNNIYIGSPTNLVSANSDQSQKHSTGGDETTVTETTATEATVNETTATTETTAATNTNTNTNTNTSETNETQPTATETDTETENASHTSNSDFASNSNDASKASSTSTPNTTNTPSLLALLTTCVLDHLKMVLIVRKDLKMKSGKVAAQCCHACMGIIFDILQNHHRSETDYSLDLEIVLQTWRSSGAKKIVLQCKTLTEMEQLRNQAIIHRLPFYIVTDAGHTQVKAGSQTVLAIGPYPEDYINKVTGHLKLY
jgi:PTH2 family peptidyl-tRNA hydrolase